MARFPARMVTIRAGFFIVRSRAGLSEVAVLSANVVSFLSLLGILTIAMGILCCAYIALDQPHRQVPAMPVMKWVWPINALWAGPLAIWAYRAWGAGRTRLVRVEGGSSWGCGFTGTDRVKKAEDIPQKEQTPDISAMRHDMPEAVAAEQGGMSGTNMETMPDMDMGSMGEAMGGGRSFPAKVAVGTLHCGAGCTLADLVGPWLFLAIPFAVSGSRVWGEWTLEYMFALLFGVVFQYAGLASMTKKRGPALWWRAFRVDFFSLTAWQVGMYAWMALAHFVLIGAMSPVEPLFWLMMQLAMACGYATAYPMNWLLIRFGIKTAM